jgi:hypothetical protein
MARASYPLNTVADPVTSIPTAAASTIPPLVRTASSSLAAKAAAGNSSNDGVEIVPIKKRKERAEIAPHLAVANIHFQEKTC